MTFETLLGEHKVTMDRGMKSGSNDEGPRPKALMLVALTGRNAMDVIPLFNRMRVHFEKMSIDVKAESSNTIPMAYTAFHMAYRIQRNREDAAKIDRAIRLSQEKYYGVGLTMKKIAPTTYKILLSGEPLKPYPNDK